MDYSKLSHIADSLNYKVISQDFDDPQSALEWLQNDVEPGQFGNAVITIDGKHGTLTYGYDIFTATRQNDQNDADDLYLHASKLDGGFINLTEDYTSMTPGEFCDLVVNLIKEYGN